MWPSNAGLTEKHSKVEGQTIVQSVNGTNGTKELDFKGLLGMILQQKQSELVGITWYNYINIMEMAKNLQRLKFLEEVFLNNG